MLMLYQTQLRLRRSRFRQPCPVVKLVSMMVWFVRCGVVAIGVLPGGSGFSAAQKRDGPTLDGDRRRVQALARGKADLSLTFARQPGDQNGLAAERRLRRRKRDRRSGWVRRSRNQPCRGGELDEVPGRRRRCRRRRASATEPGAMAKRALMKAASACTDSCSLDCELLLFATWRRESMRAASQTAGALASCGKARV